MDPRAFERMAEEELAHLPPRFARRVENVAILIEEEASPEVLREEGPGEGKTLLGLYRGIPATERGEYYSGVLPDTITLYRLPLVKEAEALVRARRAEDVARAVRLAIRETLWHELGHHFGLSESAVEAREAEGTNDFGYAQGGIGEGRRPRIMKRAPPGKGGRLTRLTVSMAKTLALIFGIVFVLIGLLGFVGNPLVGSGALFETDGAHNVVHLLLGLILLAVALWAATQSSVWLKIIGAIYLVLGILGLLMGPGMLLGIVMSNDADTWLHLVAGIILFGAGFVAKSEPAQVMPAMASTPPPPPAPSQPM